MAEGCYRTGSGLVYDGASGSSASPRLFRLLKGAFKTGLLIFVFSLLLDITWLGLKFPSFGSATFPLALGDVYFTLGATFAEHWAGILSATLVFLVALFVCAWLKDFILDQKIRWTRVDRWDTSGPTQYPDGFVFVSNRMSAEELERVKDETTRRELRALFRTPEWRAHLRERGPDESAYNWQKRKSEVALREE